MREDPLHADEREHHAKVDLEVMKLVHHPRQRGIERAQSESDEHVKEDPEPEGVSHGVLLQAGAKTVE